MLSSDADSSSDESSTTREILRVRERLLAMRERLAIEDVGENQDESNGTGAETDKHSHASMCEAESVYSDANDSSKKNDQAKESGPMGPRDGRRGVHSESASQEGSPVHALAPEESADTYKRGGRLYNRVIPIDVLVEQGKTDADLKTKPAMSDRTGAAPRTPTFAPTLSPSPTRDFAFEERKKEKNKDDADSKSADSPSSPSSSQSTASSSSGSSSSSSSSSTSVSSSSSSSSSDTTTDSSSTSISSTDIDSSLVNNHHGDNHPCLDTEPVPSPCDIRMNHGEGQSCKDTQHKYTGNYDEPHHPLPVPASPSNGRPPSEVLVPLNNPHGAGKYSVLSENVRPGGQNEKTPQQLFSSGSPPRKAFTGSSKQSSNLEDGPVLMNETLFQGRGLQSRSSDSREQGDPQLTLSENDRSNRAGFEGRKEKSHETELESSERVDRPRNTLDSSLDQILEEKCEIPQFNTAPEINHSVYAPLPYRRRPPPVLLKLSPLTRPPSRRKSIPISSLFVPPISKIWESKFDSFNHMQSEVAQTLCFSDDNVVVSAPTGAGKTGVFEMAIARFVAMNLQMGNGNGSMTKGRKMVYIAPSKALCEERFEDWSARLSQMNAGIEIALITGDGEPGEAFRDLESAHLVLSTPEKWDSITRRWTENFFLLASVKLFMLDEIHLVGDSSRGRCMETIVLRMRTIQQAAKTIQVTQEDIRKSSYSKTNPAAISACLRMIGVSATLPNIVDIAEFINANEAYSFDSSYRPVPLSVRVLGLGYIGKNEYRFWSSLDRHVPEIIDRHSDQKQSLIFCHSKKETERVAETLLPRNRNQDWAALQKIAEQIKVAQLQKCVLRGVAYHHAGLPPSDRKAIENAFSSGKIHSLCATSTLAMGVNLPAHLVIVKGTKTWRGKGYQEIDGGMLMQMIGRAGRAGLDTSGTAVIMTDNASKHHITKLSQGLGSAESQLRTNLAETFNAEVSQRVITSLASAIEWMKRSLYYIQLRNQTEVDDSKTSSLKMNVEDCLEELCCKALKELKDINAIYEDEGASISPLASGHIMSQNLIPFQAMKMIVSLHFDASKCQILKALSQIESMHFPVRRHEKKILNECHKSIKFKLEGPPSKVRVKNPSEKTFVLLQAAIGQNYFEDFSLRNELSSVTDNACRILAAAQEYNVKGTHHGQAALQCLVLLRSLCTSLWSKFDGVINQIPGIGQICTQKLLLNGITSFRDVIDSSEEAIENAAGRSKPFGKQLRVLTSKILKGKLELSAKLIRTREEKVPCEVVCDLKPYQNGEDIFSEAELQHGGALSVKYVLIAFTDRPGSLMFYQEGIASSGIYRFKCPASFKRIFIHLVSSFVGLDDQAEISGADNLRSSSYTVNRTPKPARSLTQESDSQIETVRDESLEPKSSAQQYDRNTVSHKISWIEGPEEPQRSGRRMLPKMSSHIPISNSFETKGIGTPSRSVITSSPKSAVTASEFLKTLGINRYQNQRRQAAELPQKRPPVNQQWQQAKKKQHSSQRAAYVSKFNNPFSFYRRDPNAAESSLDSFSNFNHRSSVIPSDQLRDLDTTSHRARLGSARDTPATNRTSRKRRHVNSEERISDQALLHQKAQEQADIAWTNHTHREQHYSGHSIRPITTQHGGYNSPYPLQRNAPIDEGFDDAQHFDNRGYIGQQESYYSGQSQPPYRSRSPALPGRRGLVHPTSYSRYSIEEDLEYVSHAGDRGLESRKVPISPRMEPLVTYNHQSSPSLSWSQGYLDANPSAPTRRWVQTGSDTGIFQDEYSPQGRKLFQDAFDGNEETLDHFKQNSITEHFQTDGFDDAFM